MGIIDLLTNQNWTSTNLSSYWCPSHPNQLQESRVFFCFKRTFSVDWAFECVLVPFERYGRLKRYSNIFFRYNLYQNQMKQFTNTWHRKILSRDTNMLPQRHGTSGYFWILRSHHGGFGVLIKHPHTKFKKMVCPETFCM